MICKSHLFRCRARYTHCMDCACGAVSCIICMQSCPQIPSGFARLCLRILQEPQRNEGLTWREPAQPQAARESDPTVDYCQSATGIRDGVWQLPAKQEAMERFGWRGQSCVTDRVPPPLAIGAWTTGFRVTAGFKSRRSITQTNC